MDPDSVLVVVEAHLVSVLGQDSGRAGVSFLGSERIDVLRFGPDPDGLIRYATLGMSRAPMTGADELVVTGEGPRALQAMNIPWLPAEVNPRSGTVLRTETRESCLPWSGFRSLSRQWRRQSC